MRRIGVSTTPLAQRAHDCHSCEGDIRVGDRYRRSTWVGGDFDVPTTYKECSACCERYGRPIPAHYGSGT